MTTVYKILTADQWEAAKPGGAFTGSEADARDGFIHLSTASQVQRTAQLHFKGQRDLVLVAVDAASLGAALKYEPSRGGDLFPHCYGALPVASARWARPLPLDADGEHVFPPMPD